MRTHGQSSLKFGLVQPLHERPVLLVFALESGQLTSEVEDLCVEVVHVNGQAGVLLLHLVEGEGEAGVLLAKFQCLLFGVAVVTEIGCDEKDIFKLIVFKLSLKGTTTSGFC